MLHFCSLDGLVCRWAFHFTSHPKNAHTHFSVLTNAGHFPFPIFSACLPLSCSMAFGTPQF